MRRSMFVFAAVALLAVTAIAFAAPPQRGSADLSPLASSTVSGTAKLNQVQSDVAVHLQIRGLTPGTDYRAQWYTNTTCTVEATNKVIEAFTANPAGIANISVKLSNMTLSDFGSISVVLADNTVQACGAVTLQ
ncbi:MAG TPA: hypothetical protein VKE74_31050 [Gemmataceae bacterium]|nr:hypothetical protein [Gemmataceae bacterium]